jgi:drug/metabolite transporter (DMT)-like permease
MLNFLGNFMIFSAYDEATKSGQNVGIVTAICQGSTFFGLVGSVFIYKESITIFQAFGSVLSVLGIIGLSVL